MAFLSYTVMRRVPATDEHGNDVSMAIALVTHENGARQRVAIREDLIRFAGEGIIEEEVKRAAMLPNGESFLKKHH